MKRPILFWAGAIWIMILVIAYFIPLTIGEYGNYIERDRVLGIMIFHNLTVLIVYVLAGISGIIFGLLNIKLKFD